MPAKMLTGRTANAKKTENKDKNKTSSGHGKGADKTNLHASNEIGPINKCMFNAAFPT